MFKKAKYLTKSTSRRVIALTLCAAMAASLVAVILPTLAAGDGDESLFDRLYIREADKNTMDSYVQASLGGFIYTGRIIDPERSNLDAVTTPTVRNNFGSRYAGEVWADLSVFARTKQS